MTLQADTIANTIAGRLTLVRENDSLRAQLANCMAKRVDLERRLLLMTHERDADVERMAVAMFNEDNRMNARERDWSGFSEDSHTKDHWRKLATAAVRK